MKKMKKMKKWKNEKNENPKVFRILTKRRMKHMKNTQIKVKNEDEMEIT